MACVSEDLTSISSGLRLGRSEVLRGFRHYLRAGTKPRTSHLRSPGGERRGKLRGIARESSLKGRERAVVSQTNTGTVSKANARETSERRGGAHVDGVERMWAFPSA